MWRDSTVGRAGARRAPKTDPILSRHRGSFRPQASPPRGSAGPSPVPARDREYLKQAEPGSEANCGFGFVPNYCFSARASQCGLGGIRAQPILLPRRLRLEINVACPMSSVMRVFIFPLFNPLPKMRPWMSGRSRPRKCHPTPSPRPSRRVRLGRPRGCPAPARAAPVPATVAKTSETDYNKSRPRLPSRQCPHFSFIQSKPAPICHDSSQ